MKVTVGGIGSHPFDPGVQFITGPVRATSRT